MNRRPFLATAITIPLCCAIGTDTALTQTFDERWPVLPDAQAEPSPPSDEKEQREPDLPIASSPAEPKADVPSRKSAPLPTTKRVIYGKASFYSYAGGKTASGAWYDRNALTAAHRTLPFGTRVRVTAVKARKINDRGPALRDRVLDLSLSAARVLGMTESGIVPVWIDVITDQPSAGENPRVGQQPCVVACRKVEPFIRRQAPGFRSAPSGLRSAS
jgi:rare lipoprotein A (peptidoglycan hydrolase)